MYVTVFQKTLNTASLPGTLGQPDPWDIYNRDSYQHPMVPYDVLVDPLSLPNHPVIQERENTREVLFEDCDNEEVLSDLDDDDADEVRCRHNFTVFTLQEPV